MTHALCVGENSRKLHAVIFIVWFTLHNYTIMRSDRKQKGEINTHGAVKMAMKKSSILNFWKLINRLFIDLKIWTKQPNENFFVSSNLSNDNRLIDALMKPSQNW